MPERGLWSALFCVPPLAAHSDLVLYTGLMRPLTLLSCLACALPALPQDLQFWLGAIGGTPFGRGAAGHYHDESPRYTLGPAFSVSFLGHFGVEFNALYRRLGGSQAVAVGLPPRPPGWSSISSRTRANSWEFPLLGKYYFGRPDRAIRVFAAAGGSLQRSWTTVHVDSVYYEWNSSRVVLNTATDSGTSSAVGAVLGGGVAWRAGPLTVSPEFRYTRWGERADGVGRHQPAFVLGLWYRTPARPAK